MQGGEIMRLLARVDAFLEAGKTEGTETEDARADKVGKREDTKADQVNKTRSAGELINLETSINQESQKLMKTQINDKIDTPNWIVAHSKHCGLVALSPKESAIGIFVCNDSMEEKRKFIRLMSNFTFQVIFDDGDNDFFYVIITTTYGDQATLCFEKELVTEFHSPPLKIIEERKSGPWRR